MRSYRVGLLGLALFMHFFYMDNFGGKKKDSGGKGKEAVKAKGQ